MVPAAHQHAGKVCVILALEAGAHRRVAQYAIGIGVVANVTHAMCGRRQTDMIGDVPVGASTSTQRLRCHAAT